MDNLKKTLAPVKGELKSNTGGEAVIVLMLSVMMICASIMISAIGNYAGALIYLMNPKAENAVKVISGDFFGDFGSITTAKMSPAFKAAGSICRFSVKLSLFLSAYLKKQKSGRALLKLDFKPMIPI